MAPTSACPDGDALRRLALGQLSEEEAAPLEGHLARCDRCATALQGPLAGDSLVRGLQEARAAAPLPEGDRIEGLTRRLQGLRPGARPGPDGPPARLGEYRILREVGRGGMGVVYEAAQESLGRHVALKVLPPHALLNAEQRERFRREARAAALLHHSNIVPVFGVGQDQGVHYYAMQFIHGQSLDRVLRGLRRAQGEAAASTEGPMPASEGPAAVSDPSARLAQGLRTGRFPCGSLAAEGAPPAPSYLAEPTQRADAGGDTTPRSGLAGPREAEYFRGAARVGVQVAEALAYAHRHGILHRDIKPANLLLDAQGTVWVTDFGLAKAEGNDELTRSGDVVGTLRYLAPERFDGVSDPRGDVYGLGATLYELLTLRPAFDEPNRARLIERVTCGEVTRPREVDDRIPRDLETVVLKALAREPAERYAGCQELADDLRRFLEDRPVLARRPTLRQRLGKWAKRHRGLVWAGVGLLALTAAGSTASALLVAQQRDLADARRQEAEGARGAAQDAAAEAKREAAKAEAVNTFLVQSVLGSAAAWSSPSDQAQMAKALEAAGYNLDQLFVGQPESEAAVRLMVGELYYSVGRPEKAEPHLRRGLDLRRAARPGALDPLKAEDAQTLYAMKHLGTLLKERGQWADAEPLLRQSQEALRRAEPRRIPCMVPELGWTVHMLSAAFSPDGRRVVAGGDDGCLRLFDVATGLEVHRFPGGAWGVTFSPDGRRILSSVNEAVHLWDAETARELRQFNGHGAPVQSVAFSPDGRQALSASHDKTVRLWDVETGREVRRFQGHTAEVTQAVFTPDGRHILSGGGDGTVRLWDAATGQETRRLQATGPQVQSVAVSPDGRRALSSDTGAVRLWDLATGEELRQVAAPWGGVPWVVFAPDGHHALRTEHYQRKLRLWDVDTGQELRCFSVEMPLRPQGAVISPDGRLVACGNWRGAVSLWRLDDPPPPDQALAEARRRHESARRDRGPEHADTLAALHDLGALLWDQGRPAEAEPLFRQGLETKCRALGPDHAETRFARRALAALLRDQGKAAEAEGLLRHCLDDCRRALGPDHPDTLVALADLGALLQGRGRFADAEPLWRQRWEGWRRLRGPEHPEAAGAFRGLTEALAYQGKAAEAEALHREGVERRRRALPPGHADLGQALYLWGVSLVEKGEAGRAVEALREALRIQRGYAPEGHPAVVGTLVALGCALTENGQAGEAEPMLRQGLKYRRENLAPGHWLTANAESMLGGCLAAQGRHAEAEPVLLHAHADLRTAHDTPPHRLRQARERLARLYGAWGKPDKAAAWRTPPPDAGPPAAPRDRE
jgi:serine/threonine protein kinase